MHGTAGGAAQRLFWLTTVVGGALVVASVMAMVGTATHLIQGQSTAACGCAVLGSSLTIPLAGAGAVAVAYLLAVIIRAAVVVRRTQRSIRRLGRPFATPRLMEMAGTLGLARRVRAIAAGSSDLACAGFVRPSVYVPQSALDLLGPAELRAVLRHEAAHLRRRDPLRLLLVEALTWPVRWLPATRALLIELRARIELAADEAAADDDGDRAALGGALLKLLDVGATIDDRMPVARFSATDRRIDALLGVTNPAVRSPLLAIVGLALVGLALFLGSTGLRAAEPPVGMCRAEFHACAAPPTRSIEQPMSRPPVSLAID